LLFIGAQSFDLAVIPEALAGALLALAYQPPRSSYAPHQGIPSPRCRGIKP